MKTPLRIEPMRYADLDGACCLAPDDEGLRGRLCWHLFTPYAILYKAVVDDDLVGYACGVVFPGSGWVREVFVLPDPSYGGVGKSLVQMLVEEMEEQGAMRQLVLAPEQHRMLYSACGFVVDGHLLAYQDGTFLQATKDEVVNLEPEHLLAVLRLDRLATGEDRERLLREHAYLGSVYQEARTRRRAGARLLTAAAGPWPHRGR
ncbi:MAG: GNAT family N-acetyltransferase [Flavobacteriales bacterium]|nr:GNAT family N-acetyltransferase [Flavobacteriales bacterium]